MLLPAPRPCLRLLIIMLMYVLTFQPHPFRFLMHLQGLRYVCAGKLIALQTMTNVLNYLKVKKIDFTKVNTSSCSNFFHCLNHIYSRLRLSVLKRWRKCLALGDIVKSCFEKAPEATESWGLYQTRAWICYRPSSWDWCTLPLVVPPGWGLPFHACMSPSPTMSFFLKLIFLFQIFPRKSILAILTRYACRQIYF